MSTGPTKILMFASSPRDAESLGLNSEYRWIDAYHQKSIFRDRFTLAWVPATKPRDWQDELLRHRPGVVHFCGHGAGAAGLLAEDSTGGTRLVSTDALANLFSLFPDKIECVVLNACLSVA